jgi:hypothetical protein
VCNRSAHREGINGRQPHNLCTLLLLAAPTRSAHGGAGATGSVRHKRVRCNSAAHAVYWAVKLLRPYLEGNCFTVRTDHSALTWLLNANVNRTPRLTRWRLGLAQFDFIVKYCPGVQHQPADGVSRLVTLGN